MGLSASQARLLSITARLSDNELHSQQIANSKIRLADQTQEASREYINALNTTKLVYSTYNAKGEQQCVDLTPAIMYNYAPLKNQYAMMTSANQILVSATDANNYYDTETLEEFLDRYGLLEKVVETYTTHKPSPEYAEWKEKYDEWKADEPKIENYTTPGEKIPGELKVVGQKWVHENSAAYDACTNELYRCFHMAKDYNTNCYMHVLAALIGKEGNPHRTSDGQHSFNIDYISYDPTTNEEIWDWNTYEQAEELDSDIREALKNDHVYGQPYDGMLVTDAHGTVYCYGDGSDAAKYNSPGGGGCYQKAIDLLYEVHESYDKNGNKWGGNAEEEFLKKFWYFIEFDLGDGHLEDITEETPPTQKPDEIDQEGFDNAHDAWKDRKPKEPPQYLDEEEIIKKIGINDKDKAQWYVNLWNAMNGSDTANLVCVDDETYVEDEENKSRYRLNTVFAAEKSETGNYKILEDNLMSSASWLKFALEQGVISLAKAEYYNPSEDSLKALEKTSAGITWKSIGLSAASDIHEVDDEKAIAKAEAEYTRKLNEIEAKDKKYDNDIKKLDTEHNALQTEYESISTVINKNVERSFRAFS